MIRDLLVPLLRQPSDDDALALGLALAKSHGAHLAALITVACPMPMATEWGYIPAEVNQLAFEAAQREGLALADRVRLRLADSPVASEVRVTESVMLWPEDTLALHASHCDLSLLGGYDPGQPGSRFGLCFKSLLLRSGRPVLVVPRGGDAARPLQRVVVAWTATPEAARALHEALPLLRVAREIVVLMVDPVSSEGGYGEQPGADIALHLAHHGLQVEVVREPRLGRSIGGCLLQFVKDSAGDLLVMGGYGHSRWRETILGGATRTVLEGAQCPVLFAH